MPDRFWVGGTASWDGTAGTKWATTSGGAGGASVPTTADDVFFTNLSTGTCTIAAGNTGARSINCTGFAGTITGTAAITVAGSVTLAAAMTYTHTGTVTFTGTGTLTTAGKAFSGVTVDGVGITLTLGDALNISFRSITVTRGTFDTASYSVVAGSFISATSNVRTITLGSSTITLSTSANFSPSTNLTFNAGTSQINFTSSVVTFNGGSQTFHNVSFTSTPAGTRTITGANTFNNLTLNASATGLSQLSISADQTVNGTFTCAGSSAIQRGFVRSNTIGLTCTITANVVSANDCDFRDITIAGAAAPISPTRAGDCGGNSGITFPAAKTVYRVGTNTSWQGSSSWALSSGGAGSDNNFPLAQDTAVIDNATTLTGTLALSTSYNIGGLDCSTRTNGITLIYNVGNNFHGSFTLGSGVTVSSAANQTFSGRGTMVFTSAGKTITFPIIVDAPGGTFELGDAFASSGGITLNRGTFDANNYNLTCTTFSSSNTFTRTITMGSGLWTLSGTGTVWNITSFTNLTLNKNTADILLSNTTTTARTFAGGSQSYNKLTIGGATGTSITALTGVNSFTELASIKTVAHTVRFGANQGTIDTWSITGTVGNVVTVNSSSAGLRRTFNLTNVTSGIDYLAVRDIGVNQANRFYVGANSTDNGNNLNVIFTAAPGGSVNVDVTGTEAVGSVGIGTVVASARAPPTGVEAAGQIGTVSAAVFASVSVTGVETTGLLGTALDSGAAQTTLTGVSATGEVGTVVVPLPSLVPVDGVSGTGEVGTLVVSIPTQVSVTGVEAAGLLGTALVSNAAQTALTGVQATGEVGTPTFSLDANVLLSGVSATGTVGAAFVSGAARTSLTGVEATGEVGTVAVSLPRQVALTGVEATGETGTVLTSGAAQTLLTGVEATGETGVPSFSLSGKFPVTGVSATGEVGTVIASIPALVPVTGVEATGETGTVVVESEAQIFLAGVEAAGETGTALVSGAAQTSLTGVEATGEIGTVTTESAYYVTGVSAAGAVGTVSITAKGAVVVTGVVGTGVVAKVLVWGQINDNQTPNWVAVDDSQSPGWGAIDDNQTPNWVTVDDSQSPGWGAINDGNTVVWTEIPT